ncbi:MAG: ribonuclease PH [Candidatus Lokiarchaeota archaeon]|nr:ribonuclease PH [Candidatus Lokiarchaeota archaeon]
MNDQRADGRQYDELRPCKITRHFLYNADGSCLIEMGRTRVLCAATVESKPVKWMSSNSSDSWVTAEYGLMPASVGNRVRRPIGYPNSRSIEIQRLIGRSIRGAFELEGLGECTIRVDCDVLDGDGGTRCASITGGFVAAFDAFILAEEKGFIHKFPDYKVTAAISAGIVEGKALLDLNYNEDSRADVDGNFVLDENGNYIEIQCSAERVNFDHSQLSELLKLAEKGTKELIEYQKEILEL